MIQHLWPALIGWGTVSLVVIILGSIAAWMNMKRSQNAKALYFACIIGMPALAIVVGAIAAENDKNIPGAYAAVMVAGGTVAQIILDASKRDKSPVVGEGDSRETLRAGAWSLIFVGALAGAWAVFVETCPDPSICCG